MRIEGTLIDWAEHEDTYFGGIPEHDETYFLIMWSEKLGEWSVGLDRYDLPSREIPNNPEYPFSITVFKKSLRESMDLCENWARKFMSDQKFRCQETGRYSSTWERG